MPTDREAPTAPETPIVRIHHDRTPEPVLTPIPDTEPTAPPVFDREIADMMEEMLGPPAPRTPTPRER